MSIRIGLIGAGIMGADHARILSQQAPGVTLQFICDADSARAKVAAETFSAAPGNSIDMDELARWLERNGFGRAAAVRDRGEYAVRGGILDLFPPGLPAPLTTGVTDGPGPCS